jgi:nicotinate-nucleotide pyrophosphorylase (carboxylating)
VRPSYLSAEAINHFIDSALAEDIGEGDHSTLGAVPHNLQVTARLLVKEACMLAGLELAETIFKRFDKNLIVEFFKNDGDYAEVGDVAFTVEGKAQSILSTERLVLNCMQRMSGIATLTARLAQKIKSTQARLMDTRKTTPNFRLMEKWAVHIGGGVNHRFALYDMVMLKDNHVDSAGSLTMAVELTKQYLKQNEKNLRIEVETRTLEEVKEALSQHVDVIMLDNMSVAQMKEAVQLVNKKCKLEASGGITEANLLAVAETGVDYISVGALTHSARSVDLSLKIIRKKDEYLK